MKITDKGQLAYTWQDFHLDDIHEYNYWVFDLEGTGPDFSNDRITQFGGIAIDRLGINENTVFVQLVNPKKAIPASIEKLCGITNEMVTEAPDFTQVFNSFLQKATDRIWVTQAGYEYDIHLLLAECRRHNIEFPDTMVIDTKALFTFLHPEIHEVFDTNYLVNYYRIDTTGFKRHNALGDVNIIARILLSELNELKSQNIDSIHVNHPITILKWSIQTPPIKWS
jgi:DNA polymerase-3 subunit epsilon